MKSQTPQSFWQSLKSQGFFLKLLNWEYWPMQVIYIPVAFYAIYLSIKARSFFFFANANPSINMGGLLSDSKNEIYEQLPQQLIPKTFIQQPTNNLQPIFDFMQQHNFDFPVIAKPDMGERGSLVEKIDSKEELITYHNKTKVPYLVQEFITYAEEVGILYYRLPNEPKGHITSVTVKEFLSVTGNGTDNIETLMSQSGRASLQIERFRNEKPELLMKVLPKGEKYLLEPIGNHCRGTTFLDGNRFIDEKLVSVFDEVSHQLNGIYFGRYDIKCESIEDLKNNRNWSIIELNGVKSEPTHIYQPNASLLEAYKVLFRQWRVIYDISMANKKRGIPFPTFSEGMKEVFAAIRHSKKKQS
ncbi:MAG: hypothetical protein ACPG5B_12890 [Chitinophagales bacterium]